MRSPILRLAGRIPTNRQDLILPGERLDDLGRDGLYIIQDPNTFCFGTDAVLLSSFVRAAEGERVLDFCTGNGIIPILLSSKTRARNIKGLEIQKSLVAMANRSLLYNSLENRVEILQGDVKKAGEIFPGEKFDVITANPPYMPKSKGIENESPAVRIARHEELLDFSALAESATKLIKEKGRFYLVHRPLRLVEILTELRRVGLEPKKMQLVHPFIHKPPNLVLIEAIKGAAPELRTLPPLAVYDSPGVYTPEALSIYGQDF